MKLNNKRYRWQNGPTVPIHENKKKPNRLGDIKSQHYLTQKFLTKWQLPNTKHGSTLHLSLVPVTFYMGNQMLCSHFMTFKTQLESIINCDYKL